MRIVFFGSGAFGVPTLEALAARHTVAIVVTQPDRPAGRQRRLTRTPIAALASLRNLPAIKPEDVNATATIERICALDADAFVVIAFGQKLGAALLQNVFAINLHASLLPRYRGAAPINWAMINGEAETGVSVIALADRMDAGELYAMQATVIDPRETAGELHDRLSLMGPRIVLDVLQRRAEGALIGQPQDERLATRAPKLNKSDGTVRFDQPAFAARNRIHGLTPWPGCTVRLQDRDLKLLRADIVDDRARRGADGEVLADHSIACAHGALRLLEVQAPGGEPMSWQAYRNGHAVAVGSRLEPLA